jgi:hypothetical protein
VALALLKSWIVLRLVTLAAAMVVSSASLAVRADVDVDGGVPRTAQAVRVAVQKHKLDGTVWLGKLRGVGGGRDTLLYIPRDLDASRTIELVVYMEGTRSFADDAMDHRHAASIARLRGNFVYVAPDSPSSTHGDPESFNEHWEAGCAAHACAGGRAAPGDFVVFLDEVRKRIALTLGAAKPLDLRVSLVGFSRGGRGVVKALGQLAAVRFRIARTPVQIGVVIFADGNYVERSLEDSWRILAKRPEAPRMTILVETGEFTEKSEPSNRRRALAFWRAVAPDAPLPTAERATQAPRLRLIPLAGGHHAIGDAAVDFLETMPGAT